MKTNLQTAVIGNRYQLQHVIGSGGMGVVYRAADRLTGQTVALKRVLSPTDDPGGSSISTDSRLALAQEFQILAGLRHPHIISVLDYGFDAEKRPFFTMDYLAEAITILQAGQQLDVNGRLQLVLQMLQALTYLHRRDVLHNDLKPANILVTIGQVKLLDFGLSATADEQSSTAGTWAYMSPEIMRGAAGSQASDLFAVGVITYELLAGKRPFRSIADTLTRPPHMEALPVNELLRDAVYRLLHPVPDERFQNAHEAMVTLCRAAGLAIPPETHAIRESFLQAAQFIGREQELAQLADLLQQATNGNGSTWLIGGESGVGKSRLLDELVPQALVRGVMVLRGQSVGEASAPYQLWQTILRRLCLTTELDNQEASALKNVLPDIGDYLDRPVPDPTQYDPQVVQQQLTAAFMALFRRQQQPILLLLEDLHWARSESMVLLNALAEVTSNLPLLIIGSYREGETPQLVDELPAMKHIRLDRLPPAAINELSAAMLGAAGRNKSLQTLLQRETEGNAFFLVEVVRALAEEAGNLAQIDQIPLPSQIITGGVRQVVQRRLARVPAADQPLLRLAAVWGRQLDLSLLAALAPETDLDQWLTRCAATAVLDVQETAWRFAHDKLRDQLRQDMSEAEREAAHYQIAEAIEQVYPDAPQYVPVLAYHWRKANQSDKERPYVIAAGDQALSRQVNDEARLYFSRALTLNPSPAQQIHIQRQLGHAYFGLGIYDQAQAHLYQSLTLCQEQEDEPGRAHALYVLSNVAYAMGAYAEALDLGKRSLDIARAIDDQLGVARAHSNLGAANYRLGHNEKALTHYEQCLALSQALDEAWLTARALNNLGNVCYQLGDFDEANRYYHEALERCKTLGNRRGIARALNNLALIAERQQDYETAQRHHQASLNIKKELGDRAGISTSLMNLGVIEYARQAYERSGELLQESLAICREIGDTWGIACCLSNLGDVDTALERFDQARQNYREALQTSLSIQAYPLALSVVISAGMMMIATQNKNQALLLAGFAAAQSALDGYDQIRLESLLDKVHTQQPLAAKTVLLAQGQQLTYADVEAMLA